ncbi:MAG: helix-turn-helix domain-containing protein [Candidatus Thiodiazotropha sp.]
MSRQIGAKRQRRQYEVGVLNEAVDVVKGGTMSLNKAAKVYGIPKTTIHDKVHNKYPSGNKCGAKTVLTSSEEDRICDWIIHMSKIGYGRTRQELVSVLKKNIG